ncbi:MAG: Co2+/Mg2+ efflux protein ApaG [Alphaproteobacteria bacterium]|nr:Co2+/Mg2+ efflux protein ApaG [Alphaproteobacteria bacterium]
MPPRVTRPSKSTVAEVEASDAPAAAKEEAVVETKPTAELRRPRLETETRRSRARAKDDDKRPYVAETKEIKVSVKPTFLEDQSSPTDDHYVWAYHVRIENSGKQTVQLLNRHWRITDARGRMQEVKGRGVVGEQPVLKPGQSFEYTSGVPLSTPSGIMFGTYEMDDGAGTTFQVKVPAFSLDSPHQARQLH